MPAVPVRRHPLGDRRRRDGGAGRGADLPPAGAHRRPRRPLLGESLGVTKLVGLLLGFTGIVVVSAALCVLGLLVEPGGVTWSGRFDVALAYSLLVGAVLLHEEVHASLLAGGALVIAGVYLASRPAKPVAERPADRVG